MTTHRLLSPGWLLKHLFALSIVAMMLFLGVWQLGRLEQRRAANAAALAIFSQSPTTLSADAPDPAAFIGLRVRVTGSFLNEQSVVLRGRKSASGVDGVHLLTPLRVAGGKAAVLVDRGWLPANQRDPAALAAYAVMREVTIDGIARAPQLRPDAALAPRDLPLPGERRIAAWVRVDVPALQAQVGAPLLPLFIEQLPGEGGTALPRPSDPRQLDEGPHLSYALQWFAFAAMLCVVYAGLMRQELGRDRVTG